MELKTAPFKKLRKNLFSGPDESSDRARRQTEIGALSLVLDASAAADPAVVGNDQDDFSIRCFEGYIGQYIAVFNNGRAFDFTAFFIRSDVDRAVIKIGRAHV